MTLGPQHRHVTVEANLKFLKRIGVVDVYVGPRKGFVLVTRHHDAYISEMSQLRHLSKKSKHPMWGQLITIAELMNLWD